LLPPPWHFCSSQMGALSHAPSNCPVLALRGLGARVNASAVRQSPPHWKNESVRLWRLLGGPVCASLPNSLELTPARCSGLAALSRQARSAPFSEAPSLGVATLYS